MANREGTPIWYELLTNDADASIRFYSEVVGWKFGAPMAPHGYRQFDAKDAHVGGLMQLDDKMRAGGAKPTWLFYVGVNDVDATVRKVEAAGGKILLKPFDIPNVGRVAMIADPQGIPLYVMRGSSPEESHSYERTGMGKCNWNELATPDQAAAHEFYAKVFGWTYPDKMPMGDAGDYVFAAVGDTTFGATVRSTDKRGWIFYFRVPEIEAAAARVKKAGGTIHAGPMEVPGGDRVIVASDPEGVGFGLVAPGASSAS